MAETRNIKDLPKTDAMVSGDYFLIEAPAGTQLLAFDNFVIDEDNTTFGAEMQTNITTLSTSVTSVSADLDMSYELGALYTVNTNLTDSITGITGALYGPTNSEGLTFENTIAQYILNDNETDTLGNERQLTAGNLHALSAMIGDEIYRHMRALSANIVGADGNSFTDTDYVYADRLRYTSTEGKENNQLNGGGLLGVVLDTAINSIDVYPSSVPISFNKKDTPETETGPKPSQSVSFVVPTKYAITRGSLQFTVHYTNSDAIADADLPAETDPNPYNTPGNFVITNYSSTSASLTNTRHTWTIKRVGGATLTDRNRIELHCRLLAVVGTGGISQVSTGGG